MIRYERAADVLWRTTAHGVVVLRRGEREPVSLTGPGVLLWDLFAEPTGLDDAAATLAEFYGIEPEQVSAAIVPFIDELRTRQTVTVTEGPG